MDQSSIWSFESLLLYNPKLLWIPLKVVKEENWQKKEFYLKFVTEDKQKKNGIESALCDLKNFYM